MQPTTKGPTTKEHEPILVPEAGKRAAPSPGPERWRVGMIIVLAIALIAAVTWALVERSSEETATPATPAGPTVEQIRAAVDGSIAAWTNGDMDGIEDVYAQDAVFEDLMSGSTWRGVDTIALTTRTVTDEPGWLERTSGIDINGDTAMYAFTYGAPGDVGIALIEVNPDGLITHRIVGAVNDVQIAS
jgi:hypothetical protein